MPRSILRRCNVQQLADAFFQTGEIQRLGEEIFRVHGGGALGHLARQRAHEDDGDFFGAGLTAQNFADGEAVEVRQQDVEQDQIWPTRARLAQGMDAVVRLQKFTMQIRQPNFTNSMKSSSSSTIKMRGIMRAR